MQIAFYDEQHLFILFAGSLRRNNGYGIGFTVLVFIQEQQIAGDRRMFRSGGIQVSGFPFQTHGFHARVLGNIRYAGILQAEGCKHCRPVAIGIAVPLTVAGDAAADAHFIHLEITGAFPYIQLRFGNHYDIIPEEGTADQFLKGFLPVSAGFQIRGNITVAVGGVGMLGNGAAFQRPIALIRVGVTFCFFQTAGIVAFHCQVAILGMGMRLLLFQTAGIVLFQYIAVGTVSMSLRFLLLAGKGICIALAAVGMTFRFRCLTYQRGNHTAFVMGMLLRFLQTAAQGLLVASTVMAVGGFLREITQPLSCVAVASVGMSQGFFQGTGQNTLTAIVAVGMSLLLRQGAGENSMQAIFRVGVGGGLFRLTDQLLQYAGISVDMLVNTAECFSCHGDARKFQTPEHCRDHQQRHKPLRFQETAADGVAFIHL